MNYDSCGRKGLYLKIYDIGISNVPKTESAGRKLIFISKHKVKHVNNPKYKRI